MAYAAPIAFALFLWWFATGVVLYLGRRAGGRLALVMAVMTAMALAAAVALYQFAAMTTPAAAYGGFVAALVLWAWHETSFLSGHVTGSRRSACPPGLSGAARFRAAFETINHHEIALAATLVAVVAITWGEPNQVGTLTFLLLWVMRISAKLNLFFGAPHLADDMLPARLAHLKSYFRRDRVSPFFAVSVSGATLALGIAVHTVATATGGFAVTGAVLLSTLLALAVLEHWFLVLPVRDGALWRWAMPNAGSKPATKAPYGDGRTETPAARPVPSDAPLGPNAAVAGDLGPLGLTASRIAKQT